jgi:hypothetical protein
MLLLGQNETFWNYFSAMSERAALCARTLDSALREPSRGDAIASSATALRERCAEDARAAKRKLARTLMTPLDRGEIHALTTELDGLTDAITEAVSTVAAFLPRLAPPEVLEIGETVGIAARDVDALVQGLNAKHQGALVTERVRTIADRRTVATTLANSATKVLAGSATSPIEVLQWTEILAAMVKAAGRAERVAFVIEGIALEHG